MLLFECTETTESKPVKLETIRTVVHPFTLSILLALCLETRLLDKARQMEYSHFN